MPRTVVFVLLLALPALLLISVLARPALQPVRATHDQGGGSHIDQISVDVGPTGVATGVTSNGLPAVGDRNGDAVFDAEGYDTPDEGDAAGICGNGLDDDLADSDADTVPDLADGSIDDGCVVTLSTVEDCVEIVNDGILNADEDTLVAGQDRASIDITIGSGTGGGVPANRLLSAWQYSLNWDVDVLDVDAHNGNFLILASGGASPFTVVDPAFPVGTSPFVAARSDAGPQESGPGVISRVTIEGKAAGLAVLTLANTAFQDGQNDTITIDTYNAAGVAVSKDVNGDTLISGPEEVFTCDGFTPPSSPTPPPTPTPSPTPPPPPSHIDQISIDAGPAGVAQGVAANGLPAVGDRNGDGTPDAEGYDTPDEGDATGICGNGLDDDLADFDADTVPDLADGSADDGCVVTLTAVENCVEIVDNGMLDADEDTLVGTQDRAMIDITVGSSAGSGVPADLLLSAWQYQLNWDVDVLDVDANNINFLILASGGATPFTVVAPAFPVGTSPFVTAVSDAGPQEMGPGIISRMTIEGNAPGLAVLTLSNFAFQGATSGPIAIDTVNAAGVAVSKDVNGDTVISGVAEVFDCGSFTPPTPTPTATATPTPPPPPATATPTPTPSPTPTPTPTPPPPGSFSPYSSLCLDDATTGNFPPSQGQACDGSVAVDAFSDVRTTLGVAAPQSNFAALTSYTPAALLGTPKIALGAIVGKLWSRATLGLINNACQNPIIVDFTFFYSSTDPTDTIDPKPFGQQNTLQPLAQDLDNNGLPDGVDRYPTYLARAFDQDYDKGPDGKYGTGDDVPGPLPPLEPVARFTGFTVPAGTNVNVVLVFMLFAPGTNLATLNNPDVPASAEILGYPSVTILQDPTAPPAPSAITDFCSPLDVAAYNFAISRDNPCTPAPGPAGCPSQPPFTVPFTLDTSETCDSTNKVPDPDNNEAGCPTRRNPAAGTYTFTTYTRSLRDADGDGHENLLDTCNNVPNPSWNPRFTDPANDVDSDGLPRGGPEGGCDPNNNTHSAGSGPQCPGGTYGGDEDQDCYPNRGDNCPIVFNQDQLDNDADGIGTACDANPTIDDGAFRELCIPVKITFGGSETIGVVGAAYPPPCTVAACEQGPASCPTPSPTPTPPPLDDDKDGVPNADDRCPGTTAGATVDQFGCSAGQTPGQTPGPGLLFRDARVKRIAAPHSVRLRPGVADTSGPVTLVVHQGSNHPNNVGIYLAFLPPLGSSNFAGCSPAAVVNLGSANLTPGETATIKLDPPWQCADPMAVDGVPWTLKAIADVNADDFASCATLNQVFSGACSAALANDDDDDTNNTRLRSRPLVDYRP